MAEIILEDVSVQFPVYSAVNMSLRHLMLNKTTAGVIGKDAAKVTVVQSLNGLNLHLTHGTRLGLYGHNGAGKSTLMRVIGGIYTPTAGECVVKGRVSTVFELGAGMDPELTGYENILRMGALQGFSLRAARAHLPEIAEFTGLGEFLNLPVSTYSSGMTIRLMFAVATSFNPEILLVDEMISTGDAEFQQLATTRMKRIIDNSSIFILASHDLQVLQDLCDSFLWLEHGQATPMTAAELRQRAQQPTTMR